MRNLYNVLGIAATADDRRIKSAFRRRAKAVHPDLNPGNDRAEAHFVELVRAYEVLSDARARATYDAYLAERRSEARRRFAHCAGLMAASFVLTATTALFVMSLSGAHVPFREGWQVAVAGLSASDATGNADAASHRTATAGSPGQVTPAAAATVKATPWQVRVSSAPQAPAARPERARPERSRHAAANTWSKGVDSKAPSAGSHTAADESSARTRRRVAAAPKKAPSSASHTPQASLWSWLTAPPPEEPYYGLGASGL